MRTLISLIVLVVALQSAAENSVVAQEDAPAVAFTEFNGKVVDSDDKPIEKFTINISLYDYTKGGWQATPEKLGIWKGEFENGEFHFDVNEEFAINEKTYMFWSATAKGYLQKNRNETKWGPQLRKFDGNFDKVTLSRAVVIKGKVVMPDSQIDDELVDPQVQLTKDLGLIPDYNNMFSQTVMANEDGTFECTVPENCKIHFTASCGNAAAFHQSIQIRKVESPDETLDLGEFKLKEGVSISGVVLSEDGEPVEGQVVQIKQTHHKSISYHQTVEGYAVSDAAGKFKLPPRDGNCLICLVDSGLIDGEQVKVKGKRLLTKSIKTKLELGKPVENIEIRESEAWKVHGIVEYESNDEATKPTIYVNIDNQSQSQLKLDENGNFEFEIADEVACYLLIYQNTGGQLFMARMSTPSLKKFRQHFTGSPEENAQYFQLKKVTSDIGPLEFKMVPYSSDERTISERLFDWWVFGDD